MSGWFALNRGLFNHPIFAGNPERIAAWAWIVSTAAWKETRQDANGKTVTVKRGQILTSYRQISDATGVGVQVLRTLISRLEGERAINTDVTHGRLLITLCNYEKYQPTPTASNTAPNTAPTHDQHTKEKDNNSAKAGAPFGAADPTKVLFDAGISILGQAGIPSGKARSLIGKWRSLHGEAAAIAAIGKAQREGAIDPVAFIEGCFRFSAKKRRETANSFGAFGDIPEVG